MCTTASTRRVGARIARCPDDLTRSFPIDGTLRLVNVRVRNVLTAGPLTAAWLEKREVPVLSVSAEAKPDVDQILEAVIYLMTETRRITKELARRANLTSPQLTVIKILEQIGDLSLSELSDKIRAQNSTVTGIIDRMEREGLALRVRSTEDRRVVRIRLTEKGLKLAQEIPVEPMVILRSAVEGLTAAESKELLRICMKVSRRIRTIVRRDVGEEEQEGTGERGKREANP